MDNVLSSKLHLAVYYCVNCLKIKYRDPIYGPINQSISKKSLFN